MYKYCDFQSVTRLLYNGLIKSTIKSYNVLMSDLFGAYNAAEQNSLAQYQYVDPNNSNRKGIKRG